MKYIQTFEREFKATPVFEIIDIDQRNKTVTVRVSMVNPKNGKDIIHIFDDRVIQLGGKIILNGFKGKMKVKVISQSK